MVSIITEDTTVEPLEKYLKKQAGTELHQTQSKLIKKSKMFFSKADNKLLHISPADISGFWS